MYVIVLFLLLSSAVNAADIPLDFLYKDKLIDPNCILESNISHTIDLAECSEHKDKFITSYIVNDDLYGYKYLDENNNRYPGSIGYKYLGKVKDLHVVYASTIGGTTGHLNYINYFKVEKGILKLVKRGPAGDRSFGGIYDAQVKYGTLTYSMALTPKLFMLNFSKKENSKPYTKSLPDCAICEFALVNYENNKIKSIKLNSVINEGQNDPITKCFNDIHKKYIDHKKLVLTIKEVDRFIDSFMNQCTKK